MKRRAYVIWLSPKANFELRSHILAKYDYSGRHYKIAKDN